MDADMVPPNKRRRLSSSMSSATMSFSSSAMALLDSTPSFLHSVQQLPTSPSSPEPQRIEELRLQIQTRAIASDEGGPLDRRQIGISIEGVSATIGIGTGSSTTTSKTSTSTSTTTDAVHRDSTTDSSNSDGSSTSTTSSKTSKTSETSGSGNTSSTSTSSTSDSSSSETSSSSNSNGSSSSSSTSSIVSTTSNNSTSSISSSFSGTSSHTSHTTKTPLKSDEYLVTLTNGNVETLTRSDHKDTTSFRDGQKFTIFPESTRSKSSSSTSSTSSSSSSSTHKTTHHKPLTSTITTLTSMSQAPDAQSTITSIAVIGGAPAQSTLTMAASTSTEQPSLHHNSGAGANSMPPPGTIAGGVVGGTAGLAMILLLAMVLLRWYKRRAQHAHQALPPNAATSSSLYHSPSSASGPGMAERAGIRPIAAAIPGFFRHQSLSTDDSPSTERGFTKVAGRKLPSAFSEGMTSVPSVAPQSGASGNGRNFSSMSFYRDSEGFYGGDGNADRSVSPPYADQSGTTPPDVVAMTLSPGPQRRPTVHHGGPYNMSPSTSIPEIPAAYSSTYGYGGPFASPARSLTPSSLDNRGSRFTEQM